MPSRAVVSLAFATALASSVAAAPILIPLDSARPDAAPISVEVIEEHAGGVRMVVELGALQHETLDADGRTWTALTLPDGAITGREGRPGLPEWSGLVVVPAGAEATVRALAADTHTLTDLDLLPVQPDQADDLVVDRDWYTAGRSAKPELVSLGDAASLAGVTVMSLSIRPVSYDAGSRTATVATRVEITLDWTAAAAVPSRTVPASMRHLLAGVALNLPAELTAPRANDIPGTWLILCPDNGSVVNAIQPLADWRRRQGFNVVVADLGTTGPTANNIQNWLRTQYATLDPPLEYVVLVGDANGTIALPTWSETVSGFGGEGDHYYARLDGDDILADVHVGRLSCRSVSDLQGIVAKIIGYETTPPTLDPSWYTSALIVGDPSDSGITTVYCGQWVAQQLEGADYLNILEVYGGNFASAMINGLNQGRSMFGYRGFAGMSGFSSGHASVLNNGLALPFACFPTCLTGSFRSDTVCRSEAFLANPNGGAIGAIGTATGGTHTRYNNCYYQGTFEGAINSGDHHQGAAHSRGKLELYRNYQQNEPSAVEIWSVWNNLMGDPATDLWMSVPRQLVVEHPAALPASAGALPVTVYASSQPVADARVAIVQGDVVVAVGLTDDVGAVTLPLAAVTNGSLQVTVTGHGLMPYLGDATIGDQPHWVTLDSWQLDDTAGNGDQLVNPGEALEIDLVLRNLGTATATGVNATVTSESSWLIVTQAAAGYAAIPAGGTSSGDRAIRVAVDAAAPDQEACSLRVEVTGADGAWISRFELPVVASRLEPGDVAYSGGDPLPGTSGELVVTLSNDGGRPVAGADAVLQARSPWVAVTDSSGVWGSIAPGGDGTNAGDPFAIVIAGDCPRGHLAPLTIVLTQDDGTVRRVDITLAVGEAGITDPAGPDLYGYHAYDSGDTGYPLAPVYQWVEIDPNHGGSGTDAGLSDFGYEQDDTRTVDLPFAFRYYGVDHTRLSICSNGWVSFGDTDLAHYRNWTVPSAGSPDAMIAVFWDDLRQSGSNRVYRWHDAANHRYIVQWSRMANYHGGIQNCQVILLDPAYHPTTSGDGAIVCQYHTVTNNDNTRGYGTAGIQDHSRTDGVLYTYYADYAPGAAPLVAGTAVAYLPVGVLSLATCDVDPGYLAFAVPVDGQQNRSLHIVNNGPAGSDLNFAVSQVDPTVSGGGAKNLNGSSVVLAEDGYEPGVETTLHLSVTNGSPDDEWIIDVALDFPPGVNVLGASNMTTSNATLGWNGATGDGAEVGWNGDYIYVGFTGQATITIVAEQGLGELALPWTLQGDNYGAPPHSLAGTITLPSLAETIRVESPIAGDIWARGETRDIGWYTSVDITAVDVELTRDGATWETLAVGVPATDGAITWAVTGPVSSTCQVRVSASSDASISDTSNGVFIIQHDLTWLSLDAWSGIVPAGETVTLDASVDAAGLAEGTHEQLLIITHNGGSAVVVPVTLDVGDILPVDDLPRIVALMQNHPNPFNPATTIDFALPAAGPVDLSVYDLAGRRVAVLVTGHQPAGHHTVLWQATDRSGAPLSSGTYIYRLRTETGDHVKKLSLVR